MKLLLTLALTAGCGSATPPQPPSAPPDTTAVVVPPADPAPPASPKPDVAADCKRLEVERRWADLLDCGRRLATTDATTSKVVVDLATSEAKAEVAMRKLRAAAKGGDAAAAKAAHADIPATSVYRAEAVLVLADMAPGPQLGADCTSQACAAPATCVSYRGIAGARGPEFKSCEIKCADAKSCPGGTKCVTIADGPGRVCR